MLILLHFVMSNRVRKLAAKFEAMMIKSFDIYEDEKLKPKFNSGDIVSYMRQEAIYITQMSPGKALIHLRGKRKTDFTEVAEDNLSLVEVKSKRNLRRERYEWME